MTSFSPKKQTRTSANEDQNFSLRSSQRTFKRLQRSPSHKSGRSSSKQSNTDIYKYCYIKDICFKQISANSGFKINQEPESKKKRQPTPCKSRKLIPNRSFNSYQQQLDRVRLLESNIAIHQHKEQLKQKQNIMNKMEFQNRIQKQQILNLQKQVHETQQRNSNLIFQIKESREKIAKLQQTVLDRQQNLNSAKNNLQKLKKSIQQNRVNDLKKQNQTLKVKIKQMNQQMTKLTSDIQNKEKQIIQLDKQNKFLKSKIQMESKIKGQSMRENYLQNQIKKLRQSLSTSNLNTDKQLLQSLQYSQQEKIKLKNQVKKLMIQLNYIQRKHLQQIKIFTKAKGEQLTAYKKKYKTLQQQYLNKKKEVEQSRKSQCHRAQISIIKTTPKNNILVLSDDNRNRRLSSSFQLSPD